MSNRTTSFLTKRTVWRLALCLAVSTPFAAQAQMDPNCGSLSNAYGPFDYSNPVDFRTKLKVVEDHHFDAGVESLRGHARKPDQLGGDLDYTLRAFPNHHRALYAVVKYASSKNPKHRRPLPKTPECYFQRAITFQPRDGKVRLLYGLFKSRQKQYSEAKMQFAEAERLMPESAEVQYNIGLVLAKNKEYDDAYQYAVRAYDMGYPLPGLRNILRRAGKWPSSSE
ncbi:MAG: hypothetical protein AAF465_06350 [Pseudomonadota bacterium]